jgi:hypothetical protein
MSRNSKSIPQRALITVCLVLGVASFAAAGDGRQFVGHYQISEVTEQGNSVHLTMRLQVFNYSGQDIRQGAVALYTSDLRSETAIGGFSIIKLLPNTGSVDITHQFVVSAREYKRWQEQGIKPALFFLNKDASGKTLKRSITVARAILPKVPAQ